MKREPEQPQNLKAEKSPSPGQPLDMNITFYLQEDGQVTITDLPEELLGLVRELDPHAEIFCHSEDPRENKPGS